MVKKIIKYVYNVFRLKNKNVKIHVSCDISLSAEFEGYNHIDKNTIFCGHIGKYSYIGADSIIDGKIGRFTSIGVKCWILRGTHQYTYPFATTSPIFYSLSGQCGKIFAKAQLLKEHTTADSDGKYPIIIGNDCWINSDVKFVAGVSIGDGAVVLAGSVVTKDVPPYAIVGGVPAKIIKYRYDEEDIDFLQKIKWWDFPESWLQENSMLMCDIKKLKEYVKNKENH